MDASIPNGTLKVIDGQQRIHYDGYWIKTYDPPADTLKAKKKLIEALTRRLFNHVEHGINIPGSRLNEARRAYETELDPARKRVKGAMLAGALFNRAADIFTKLVELQECGVEIDCDNSLMRECGHCLQEALQLGRLVLHRSGDEGIDELWGEPFRAFSCPVEAFYEGRYIKIAQSMRDIDRIAGALTADLGSLPMYSGIKPLVSEFAVAAKDKAETLRTDPMNIEVWTSFVVAGERLVGFTPNLAAFPPDLLARGAADGIALIRAGRDLVEYITRARTPMPKSTAEFIERLKAHHDMMMTSFPAYRAA